MEEITLNKVQKTYILRGKQLEKQLALENESEMVFNLMRNRNISMDRAMDLMGILNKDRTVLVQMILKMQEMMLEDENVGRYE